MTSASAAAESRDRRSAADRGFQVLDLLDDPTWHVGTDGLCDWVNRAWLAFTGRSMEEESGRGWEDSIHPDDREACLPAWQASFGARRPVKLEYRLRHRDGGYRWIASSGTPEFDGEGRFRGYFGSCHDIHDRKTAESRLARKERLLEAIVESVDSLVIACNDQGRLLICNRTARDLAGAAARDLPPEEWIRSFRLLDPASGEPLPPERMPLYRAWKGEKVADQEIDIVDADGRVRRLLSKGCALHGSEGELLGAVVLAKDISAQREAEEQRRRDHARKRVIADILALSLDTAPLPTKLQKALEAILEDACQPIRRGHHFSLRLEIEGEAEVQAATPGLPGAAAHCCCSRPIATEGRQIGTLHVATTIPCDPELRELFDTVGTLLANMVQRTRRDEKITQLSRVVEQNNTGILITDAAGTILYANPALSRIRGYDLDEVVGAKPSLFKSGRTPDSVYRELWSSILAGEDWTGELRNRRKDGSLSWERVTISPIRDREGNVINFVANCDDLTLVKEAQLEREALENRLAQAEKMEAIGHLAGGIAHDFNNILVAILGFAELAQKDFGAQIPKLGNYLDHCLRAGMRAKDLVAQLLTFSRNSPVDAGPLSPGPIVEEVVKLLRSTIPSSLSIALSVPERLPHVRINPTQLHQVMMNLCINARDATGGRGRLDISLREARGLPETYCASCHKAFGGDYVAIVVRDDGTGIPAAERDRIFDPFFTTKDVGKGTGMGLSVVHGIVHFNEGHVVLAEPAAGGAEFVIYLPIAAPAEASRAVRHEPEVEPVAGQVLVIDDEEVVAEFARAVLEGIGCRVSVQTDSLAAWNLFAEAPQAFDLVIVDQTMPNLTGRELCAKMLALRPELPIVLWTGFSTEIDDDSAAAMGISRFLLKPVSASAIASVAGELLSEKGRRPAQPHS